MTTRKHIGLIALFFLVLSIGNATAQA